MEKTAFKKIIERHLVETLPDGSMVLKLDWVRGHEITTVNAIIDAETRGCDVVFNPNKVKMMVDHVVPSGSTDSAIQAKILREWSAKHHVEFLEVGKGGICHAVTLEKGWVRPGEIGIMGDSHTGTGGVACAFEAGVGTTDLETAMITGLWICQQQKVIRVNFTGNLPANVFAKDIILQLIKRIGVNGATNAVLEFGGPVIDKMSIEGRTTISNMAIEAGATSGMCMLDEKTFNYFWPVIRENNSKNTNGHQIFIDLQRLNSDPGAEYDKIIEIDVSNMLPSAAVRFSPGDVVNVAELSDGTVNQVYIGGCTNGRIEDLRIVASIIQRTGGKIANNVRCIIVPATQYIYQRAIEEGLIEIFIKAGCFVSGPTCGACLGMSCGVIAPNEICVSTTNRNFYHRMGRDGIVILVSPATAALTAMKGKIIGPTVEMCETALLDCYLSALSSSYKSAIQLTDWKNKPFTTPDYSSSLDQIDAEHNATNIDFSGKPFYLPIADIDTDQIIPAVYLNKTDKGEFGKHCLEGAPISDDDRKELRKSQIIIAGENFGCGSSREHAPWAFQGIGINCIIASSFARIFQKNMFANGLLCITLSKEIIDSLFSKRPEKLFIYWEKGIISLGSNSVISFEISEHQKELIVNGGSVGVMLKLAAKLQMEGKI